MSNLQQHVRLEDLDAVVITHRHPDHWSDLEGLAIAFKWSLGIAGPLVYAPKGLRDLLRVGEAVDVFEWSQIDETTTLSCGDMQVSFSKTDHPVPTFAVRIECLGRTFGYSADTGPAWRFGALGSDLDLAICEATFLADKEGTVQHMSARQAGTSASEARARRLVITHLTPGISRDAARLEAEQAFGGPVEVAAIGAKYEV
jgi:ribonuclease BN (tRNA processing enzyme)